MRLRLGAPVREPTFEELETLVRQRAKLKNSAFDDGLAAVVRHFAKTVFRLLLFDAAFYTSIFGYVLLRWYGRSDGLDAFPLTPISCVGSLAAFIVVFFTSQAWQRFVVMYNLAMALEGRIFDATLMAQSTLPPAAALQLWRYLNAAHVLLYLGVSPHYREGNLLRPLNEQYRLLNDAEMARLSLVGFSGGTATREVVSWAVTAVQAQYKAGNITDIEKGPLLDQVTRFRAAMGALYDYQDMPFPFIYVSFVTVVCHFYGLLFAAATAMCFDTTPGEPTVWAHEVIAFAAVFLNTCFFTGLHGIAAKLQDPFAHAYEDLSVLHFVRFTCQASAKILLRAPPPLLDAAAEEQLASQRAWGPAMGAAFVAAPAEAAPCAALDEHKQNGAVSVRLLASA